MYKLLIADDEKQTREGIAFFIENNPCGFHVAGVAEGGLSALSIAMEQEPDLVLTDIRMPDLNGFELTERLSGLAKKPAILIMSAYDDVEYFKTAFKVNALDYILKPIDPGELLAVLGRVKKQLDAEEEERRSKEAMRKHMQNNLSFMRSRVFAELLDGASINSSELMERMEFLKMILSPEDYYCIAIVSIDNKQETYGGINRSAEKVLGFGIQNLLEELLENYVDGYVFEYDRGEFVLLMREEITSDSRQAELFNERVKALVEALFDALKESGISATIGIGEAVNGVARLSESFREARSNADKKLVLGKNRIIQKHEYEILEDDHLFQSLNEVRAMITAADQEQLISAIEQYFQSVAASPKLDLLYGIQCSGMLMAAVVETLLSLNDNLDINQRDILYEYEKLGKTETIPEMMQETIAYCLRLNQLVRDKVVDQNDELIKKIRKIIESGYRENLTIQSIAEQVFLSPNYLCGIFKEITGHTINQYITKVRIDAAKSLLEDTGVRLADIGNLVGYTEPSYFSKIFKRYTALTPKEYRQMLIGIRKSK